MSAQRGTIARRNSDSIYTTPNKRISKIAKYTSAKSLLHYFHHFTGCFAVTLHHFALNVMNSQLFINCRTAAVNNHNSLTRLMKICDGVNNRLVVLGIIQNMPAILNKNHEPIPCELKPAFSGNPEIKLAF